MSTYTVNEICWRLVHDADFRQRLKSDAALALAAEDLDEVELAAILAGDVGELHKRGAHDFLLGHLARYGVAGLTVPAYNERMRAMLGVPLYEEDALPG